MRTNIHALSGIRTHDLIVQAIKAYTPDSAATGTGLYFGIHKQMLSLCGCVTTRETAT
jgi:hypothetical protein